MEGSSWDAGDSLNVEDGFQPGIMVLTEEEKWGWGGMTLDVNVFDLREGGTSLSRCLSRVPYTEGVHCALKK